MKHWNELTNEEKRANLEYGARYVWMMLTDKEGRIVQSCDVESPRALLVKLREWRSAMNTLGLAEGARIDVGQYGMSGEAFLSEEFLVSSKEINGSGDSEEPGVISPARAFQEVN